MPTYEFDNHKFPSLIEVQKYINPIIKRCKFMSEINATNMFYPFFISLMKVNRIKIDEKNIYYFFFEKEEVELLFRSLAMYNGKGYRWDTL